ncbi:MAG: phage Gp37/Gp68 family protein [Dehalococcoidia bacterium]
MGDRSAIEWTQATWNPVTGCTKVSPGCAHCYAEAFTLRFKRGGRYIPGEASIKLHRDRLGIPLRWNRPRLIFVNSMSDLFHESIPDEFILAVFSVMEQAHHHIFQVLTKRHKRLARLAPKLPLPDNVWMGVSVENQHWVEQRIPELKKVPAKVRFLSCEPLLRALDLSQHLDGIHWVIVGGESGPKARPIHPDWVRRIRDDAVAAGVPFFFKQWGGRTSKARGRMLEGRIWSDMPLGETSPPFNGRIAA